MKQLQLRKLKIKDCKNIIKQGPLAHLVERRVCPDALMKMQFYIYILKSNSTGIYYTGSCEDLEIRLKQHNSGIVRSTKNNRPWKLVYHEIFSTRIAAIRRERQIKSWKKRAAIEKLIIKSQ
jgi:putative endonuclease